MAYCDAVDSRMKDLLVLGETRDVAAMRHARSQRSADTEGGVWKRLQDEYKPRTAGRQCALLPARSVGRLRGAATPAQRAVRRGRQ